MVSTGCLFANSHWRSAVMSGAEVATLLRQEESTLEHSGQYLASRWPRCLLFLDPLKPVPPAWRSEPKTRPSIDMDSPSRQVGNRRLLPDCPQRGCRTRTPDNDSVSSRRPRKTRCLMVRRRASKLQTCSFFISTGSRAAYQWHAINSRSQGNATRVRPDKHGFRDNDCCLASA